MKTTTIIIAIAVIAVLAVMTGYVTLPTNFGPSPSSVYAGRVKVNLVEVKRLDGSAYELTDAQKRMIHGDMDYNNKVGTISSSSVTGDLAAADKGYWYLVIDYGTNTTAWLDHGETKKQRYVSRIFGSDGDQDGFDEEYIELYFGGLSPLIAGESYKEVEVTLVSSPARVASNTFTSLTNASGITNTAYAYKTATGYTSGVSEGDLMKIAKITITADTTGTNETYPDLDYWILTHLKIGPYTFTASDFGDYDLANTRYQIEFGDQINHQGGKDLYYPKNGGDLWAPTELKAYAKYAANVLTMTVNLYLYKPDGTVSSAVSWATTWTSA